MSQSSSVKQKKLLANVRDLTSVDQSAVKREEVGTNSGDAGRYVECI